MKIKEILERIADEKRCVRKGREESELGRTLNVYDMGKQDGKIEFARELLLILNQKELFE